MDPNVIRKSDDVILFCKFLDVNRAQVPKTTDAEMDSMITALLWAVGVPPNAASEKYAILMEQYNLMNRLIPRNGGDTDENN